MKLHFDLYDDENRNKSKKVINAIEEELEKQKDKYATNCTALNE
ncbi:hypothetical protein ES702_03388 [subsurface metagenome]